MLYTTEKQSVINLNSNNRKNYSSEVLGSSEFAFYEKW